MAATAESAGLLKSLGTPTLVLIAIGFVLATALALTLVGRPKLPHDAPEEISGQLPLVGSLDFFSRRHEFFAENIQKSKTGNFTFWVGKTPVVGLGTAAGRRMYFDSRDLNLGAGYAKLFAGAPPSSPNAKEGYDFDALSAARFTAMLKSHNMIGRHNALMHDCARHVRLLVDDATRNGGTAITDPYESIYAIVFNLTMRMVGPYEIADDPKFLANVLNLYEMIEDSTGAATIISPWMPTKNRVRRTYAGIRLFMILKNIVDTRAKTGTRRDDAMQFLIDQGDSVEDILKLIVGALFAGQLNTGISACAMLCQLAVQPQWVARYRAEIAAMLARHTPESAGEPVLDRLLKVPLAAWEAELPTCDLCIKEIIRLELKGSGFRKNTSGHALPIPRDDPSLPAEVVPAGAYVAMHFQGMHLDPKIYPDPFAFDPARYADGATPPPPDLAAREWAGWGAGRHPCLGMRFAKLEQCMITAMFVQAFDFEAVDAAGVRLDKLPPSDFNFHSAHKPEQRTFLRFSNRKGTV